MDILNLCSVTDMCFMCTNENDCKVIDEQITSQIQYLMPEITIIKLDIPLRICSFCDEKLHSFNQFKHACLRNSQRMESNIRTIQNKDNTKSEPPETDDRNFEEIFIKEEPMEDSPEFESGEEQNIEGNAMFTEDTDSCTAQEMSEISESTASNHALPSTSEHVYKKLYDKFEKWRQENKVETISEKVLLLFFEGQRKKYKPSTLWTTYSILRACLSTYKQVDISKYYDLQAFLKRSSEGYTPKKSKILEEEDIHKFIQTADDRSYLAMKIILIMGYSGACKRDELTNMSIDDIEFKSDAIMVTVRKTKNNTARVFAITDEQWINLVKKYVSLRPKHLTHRRFFLTYRNGHCIISPIGINTMGKVSKDIATFLKLPEPELFSGQCFKRSSNTHLGKRGRSFPVINYLNR